MAKRRSRKLRRQTRWLAMIIMVLLVLIIGLAVYQLVSGGRGKGSVITVMLDNAHGGDNSGYQGIISEDEYNEHVIDALQVLLENDDRFRVMRTHEDGQAMAVSTRVEVIDEAEPDIVLSVRCHNGDSPNFTTMLVFANPPASKYHEDSEALATTITEVYTDAGYAPQCGYYYYHPIKTGYYQEHLVPIDDKTDYEEESWDLMNAKAPVVIVSQINVNNEEEAAAWGTEEGWKKAADLYYRALVNCYKAD